MKEGRKMKEQRKGEEIEIWVVFIAKSRVISK